MLTKLRNQILLFEITFISLIMLGSLITIFWNFSREQNRIIKQELNDISNQSTFIIKGKANNNGSVQPKKNAQVNFSNKIRNVSPNLNNFFNAEVTNNRISSIFPFDSKNINYNIIASQILKKNKPNGRIKYRGRTWEYQISRGSVLNLNQKKDVNSIALKSNQTHTIISALDITRNLKLLEKTKILFLYIGFISILGISTICYYLTKFFLIPIKKTWESQRQFVSDASHELKTPISIINSNVDVLRFSPNDTIASQQKWIDNICIGTARMEHLINQMLELSRLESGDQLFLKSKVDISHLTNQIINNLEANLIEKKIKFTKQITSDIKIETNQELVEQIIEILCDNAIKYCPFGKMIEISLNSSYDKVVFVIKNSGDEIPEPELSQIFNRFYRIEQSRTGKSTNFGMGLAIAKASCTKISGQLVAKNGNDGLITFILTLRNK